MLTGGQNINASFFALSLTDSGSEAGQGQSLLTASVKSGGAMSPTSSSSVMATTGLLCSPDVLNVVPVYRPTLKFATKVLAIIGLTGESALARGN